MTANTCNTCSLSMIYAGYKRVGTWWNYPNVISPFYRLYYIEKGAGRVYIGDTCHELTPGSLFLIPKFTFHSYGCSDYMDHYYICFFDDPDGAQGLPEPARLKLKVTARPTDATLMKRYLELNPHRQLVLPDPKRYDNSRGIYRPRTDDGCARAAAEMESQGILLQLFSRFVTEESVSRPAANSLSGRLNLAVQHVSRHLDRRITVSELAGLAHVTPAHFSKVFKQVMGLSPCEYVQLKRIERAQALLLTTDLSIGQIAGSVGIASPSQFTRLFTKIARRPPLKYRAGQTGERD